MEENIEHGQESYDDELDQVEDQFQIQDDVSQEARGRQASDSVAGLFWKTLHMENNKKLGNVGSSELGELDISVRDCFMISDLARDLGHPTFADFFQRKGELILQTSASRDGWLTNLFVSQKKSTERKKRDEVQIKRPFGQDPNRRRGLFKRRGP